jgi:Thaumatin family
VAVLNLKRASRPVRTIASIVGSAPGRTRTLGGVTWLRRTVMLMSLAGAGLFAAGLADAASQAAPSGSAATAASRASAAGAPASPRTITLVNRTDGTIWPAAWPGSLTGRTGWRLDPGARVTITVAGDWNARLWGRTGCRFDGAGRGSCQTGDCAGRFQCRGWGAIPATLAEYDLDAYDHLDFYDVSMVDGSNLPMYINTAHGTTPDRISAEGCEAGHGCTRTVQCPKALQVHHGGHVVACISPCARFGTDRYCCRGRFAAGCNPATTWPIDYARVFKRAEPYAYSWSGDDATSVFTCAGGCDYRITFGVTPPAVGGPPG